VASAWGSSSLPLLPHGHVVKAWEPPLSLTSRHQHAHNWGLHTDQAGKTLMSRLGVACQSHSHFCLLWLQGLCYGRHCCLMLPLKSKVSWGSLTPFLLTGAHLFHALTLCGEPLSGLPCDAQVASKLAATEPQNGSQYLPGCRVRRLCREFLLGSLVLVFPQEKILSKMWNTMKVMAKFMKRSKGLLSVESGSSQRGDRRCSLVSQLYRDLRRSF
jgi:hypothetical protein